MHDVVTLGEALLRLAVPSPGRFETARQLDVHIGGAEANVAAACARLGLKTAWISALPENAWGERVRRELCGHNVDCAFTVSLPGTRMGLYFVEYGLAPRPTEVLYDRHGSAFAHFAPEMVNWQPVRDARIVHITGVTAALGENGRALVRRTIEEAAIVSFDINYRSTLWPPHEARTFAESILPRVRYLFLGESEARIVFGHDGPLEATIETLASRAPDAVIAVLQGQRGSTVYAGGHLWRPSIRYAVNVVDPIGAGDAYVAGYLWACLRRRSPQEAVDTATTVAALKCSTWGDIALINERDVVSAFAGGPDVRR
jgi:2-dehydro-3-deoxygluconokinase